MCQCTCTSAEQMQLSASIWNNWIYGNKWKDSKQNKYQESHISFHKNTLLKNNNNNNKKNHKTTKPESFGKNACKFK